MVNLHNSAIFIIWLAVQFEIGSCYPARLAVFRIVSDIDGQSANQHESYAHNAYSTEKPEEPLWNIIHIKLKLEPEMKIKKGENGSQNEEYDYEKIEDVINSGGHDERELRSGYIFRKNIEVDDNGYAHIFYYFRERTEMDKDEDDEQVGYHFELDHGKPKGINDNQKRGNQEKRTEGSTEEKDSEEFQREGNEDGEMNDKHEEVDEENEDAGDELGKVENEEADNDDIELYRAELIEEMLENYDNDDKGLHIAGLKEEMLKNYDNDDKGLHIAGLKEEMLENYDNDDKGLHIAGLKEEMLENYDDDAENLKGLVEDEDEENEESSMKERKEDQNDDVEAENHEDIDANLEHGNVLVIEGLGHDQKSEREVNEIEAEETTIEKKGTTSNEQQDIGQIIGSVEKIETSTDFVDMITEVYHNSYASDEINSGITSSKEELEQEENSSQEEFYNNEDSVDPSKPLEIKGDEVDFLNNKETEIGSSEDDSSTESIGEFRNMALKKTESLTQLE